MSDLSEMNTQELLLEYIKYLTQAANARSEETESYSCVSANINYYKNLDKAHEAINRYNKAYQMMTVIQDILILRGFDSSFFEENRLE